MKTKTLLIFGLILLSATLFAQKIDSDVVTNDTTQVHLLMTNSGAVYEGRTIETDSSYILFLYKGDTLDFQMEEIHHLSLVDINVPEDQLEKIAVVGAEKVFLSPSGFSLKARQTEIHTIWLAFNSVEYGFTDHLSFGVNAGISIIDVNMLGGKIKGSYDFSNTLHAAAGAGWLYLIKPESPNQTTSYLYGTLTVGSRERFFNLTSGFLHTTDDVSINANAPFLSLGASWRIKRQWKLIAEYSFSPNRYVEEFNNLFVGGSFFWKKPRFDFGIALAPGSNDIELIPILAYAYVF